MKEVAEGIRNTKSVRDLAMIGLDRVAAAIAGGDIRSLLRAAHSMPAWLRSLMPSRRWRCRCSRWVAFPLVDKGETGSRPSVVM